MTARAGLVLAATIGMGIVGGVFFAFSTFVMPALARLPPAQAAAAMRAINVTAINVWLMTALFGSALLAVVLAATAPGALGDARGRRVVAGTVVYLAGVVAVTILANVPRNEALARMSEQAATAFWPRYLAGWTAWNHVRTVTAIIAAACFAAARGA